MYIFLFIVALILLLTHAFVFYIIILAFSLYKYKIIIYLVAFFLSISFILSSILIHFFDNIFSKTLYYFSSLWLWLLSNLFIFFIILSIVILFLSFFNFKIDLKIFVSILISFSFLILFYWFYNANNPIVKNVDISIKNLPEIWKSKKIIMISDVHLWAIIWKKRFSKIVNKINYLNPDIVFITWDLLDWSDWHLEETIPIINTINSKDWIYFVNWNHETYLWKELSNKILSKTKLNILDDEIKIIDWVQIIWVSYLDERIWKIDIKEKLKSFKKFDKNLVSILLYHSPVFTKEFIDFWINLQLSWHTHKWQIWPYNFITKLIYTNKDYWLYKNWDFNLYTTNWVWTWWPPIRLWNKPEIVIINLK